MQPERLPERQCTQSPDLCVEGPDQLGAYSCEGGSGLWEPEQASENTCTSKARNRQKHKGDRDVC